MEREGDLESPTHSTMGLNSQVFSVSIDGGSIDCSIHSRILDLSNRQLGDVDADRVMEFLIKENIDDTIYVLNLSSNGVSADFMQKLSNKLKKRFNNLKELILHDNRICDSGLEFLYGAIKSRVKDKLLCFSVLDIGNCGVKSDGAMSIHRMIRRTYGNLDVIFKDNQINGEGVGYIYSAKLFESLTIDNNTLDVTYMFFAKHVKSHSHMLKEVRILNNNLSPSTVQQLPRLFTSFVLPSLRVLYIRERLWDAGVISLLDDSVNHVFQNLEHFSFVETCSRVKAYAFFLATFKKGRFPRLIDTEFKENGCFMCKTICKSISRINTIWQITVEMYDDTDYTDLLAAGMCVESVSHFIVRCNRPSAFFPSYYDAVEKRFLRNLVYAECTGVVIAYADMQAMYNYVLPKLQVLILNGIQLIPHRPPEIPVTVESFRGTLYSTETHRKQELTKESSLSKCQFTDTTLCDSIFPFLVYPMSFRATSIDVRRNNITDAGVKYLYDRLKGNPRVAVKELLLDMEKLSVVSQMMVKMIVSPDDNELARSIARLEGNVIEEEMEKTKMVEEPMNMDRNSHKGCCVIVYCVC